ncbi:MAG TPA: hypothetical protein VLA93_12520 [Pyrinomonadaceae bacterium]|nr:hypothetical protein [Pyrinomonadaceae bacterium]
MNIHLALVDDWELSGNGTGDVRSLQFEPLRKLVGIYNALSIHGSFNAEVMQQLTFRKHQSEHPELKAAADEWDQVLIDAFAVNDGSGRRHYVMSKLFLGVVEDLIREPVTN